MHPASAEASPSTEFDFDTSTSYSTAWDAAPSRRPRKQYGKTNSQKKEARRRGASNNRNRKVFGRSESEPLESSSGEISIPEEGFVLTSNSSSSTSLSVNDFIPDGEQPPPPMPARGHRLTRSKSVTGLSTGPRLGGNHQRQQSFSALMRSASMRSSSSSSSTLFSDFELEHENQNPNLITQENSHNRTLGTPPPQASKPRVLQLTTMEEHPKARPQKIRALSDFGDLRQSFSDLAKNADATTSWDDATPTNATSIAFDLADFESSSPPGSITTVGSRKRGVCDSAGMDELSASSNGGGHRHTKSRSRIYSPNFAPMMGSVRSLNATKPTKKSQRPRQAAEIDSDDGAESCDSDDDMISCDPDKSFDSTGFDFDSIPSARGLANMSMPPRPVRRSASYDFESSVFGAARAHETKVLSNEGIVDSMPSAEDLKFLIKNLRKSQKGASTMFGKQSTWTVSLPSQWASERRAKVLQWASQDLGFSMRTGGPSVVFLNVSASRAPGLLSQLESAFGFHRERSPTGKLPKAVLDQPPSIIFQKLSPALSITSSVRLRGYRQSSPFDSLDDELIQAVNNLDLTSTKPSPEPSSDSTSALLVRHVTLDPHHDAVNVQPPRHSGEHMVGGINFVNHMHVVSPRRSRAPRTSCPRTNPRGPRLSIETTIVAASPFVRSTTKMAHAAECVETPHMTRRSCWERPKNGRDWGATDRCPDHVLRALVARFEADLAENGIVLEDDSSSVFFDLSAVPANNTESSAIDRSMDSVDEEDSEAGSNQEEDEDQFGEDFVNHLDAPPQDWNRRSSVGASAFESMNLNEFHHTAANDEKVNRRRMGSMAKHKRVSLCANVIQPRKPHRPSGRHSYFAGAPRLSMMDMSLTDNNRFSFLTTAQVTIAIEEAPELVHDGTVLADSKILLNVLSFLDESELLCRASPVCTLWADVSTEAHSTLMLSSVGCSANAEEAEADLDDDDEEDNANASIMRSMEKSWKYMVNQYPWACFLSEGAFKRVYKVWNTATESEEAISVM
jgi:hypothetical protein